MQVMHQQNEETFTQDICSSGAQDSLRHLYCLADSDRFLRKFFSNLIQAPY
jgi:hypothetical protein